VISLSSCSKSRSRILATILVDASMLPYPRLACTVYVWTSSALSNKLRTAILYSCFTTVKRVALKSSIKFFKIFQAVPTQGGCSQIASLKLSRDGLWISCWRNTKLTELMLSLTNTNILQQFLGQRRSGVICSNGRY
jgi:hypothetical protein